MTTETTPGALGSNDQLGQAPTRATVDALMKRCQIGVGGRNALDNAHSIMAECYGTLGRQQIEIERLREAILRLDALLRDGKVHGATMADSVALSHAAINARMALGPNV